MSHGLVCKDCRNSALGQHRDWRYVPIPTASVYVAYPSLLTIFSGVFPAIRSCRSASDESLVAPSPSVPGSAIKHAGEVFPYAWVKVGRDICRVIWRAFLAIVVS